MQGIDGYTAWTATSTSGGEPRPEGPASLGDERSLSARGHPDPRSLPNPGRRKRAGPEREEGSGGSPTSGDTRLRVGALNLAKETLIAQEFGPGLWLEQTV